MTESKVRLDILLTDRGLIESRSLAQRQVMAGQVRVDGQVVIKPSAKVNPNAEIVVEQAPRFVSRGGEKLEPALVAFELTDLSGLICADIGSSTGGFTDCMLQYGAACVYAIDVGYGILHWKLRSDPRVVVMERTNARYVQTLPQPVNLITIDASFISLRVLLPVCKAWFGSSGGLVIALIKPQFEAGRKDAAKNDGVIRDHGVHRRVLEEVIDFAQAEGFCVAGLIRSPVVGPKGNIEFLALFSYHAFKQAINVTQCIDTLMDELSVAPPSDK